MDRVEAESLLERLRSGDSQALEHLFAGYRDYLCQVVRLRLDQKLRARVDASDVVQEAQLEALRRIGDYLERPEIPFRLWLRRIACDRLVMAKRQHLGAARRSLGRESPLPENSSLALAKQLLAGGSTPSQQLGRRELARGVRQALGKLADADREILLMRNFEGLSNHEVAHVLQIDAGTASKRYGRALLRLREHLLVSGLTESQL